MPGPTRERQSCHDTKDLLPVTAQPQVGRYTFDFSETQDTEGNTEQDAVSSSVPSEFTGLLNAPFPDGANDLNPDTQLVKADGTVLKNYTRSGTRSGEWAAATENDTGEDLFMRVFWATPGRGAMQDAYRCTAVDSGVDDHPDAPPEATVVTVPSTTDVHLWPEGEVDVLAVDLVEGHKYLLSSRGQEFYAATTVMDAQGAILAKDLVSNFLSGAEYTAPGTGRYFLSLRRVRGPGVWKFINPTSFPYSISEVVQ